MSRIGLFLLLVSTSAFAQSGPGTVDVMSARAYGMAGAFRSLGSGTEVIDGNPAALGVYKRYLIELSGGWDPRNPFGFGSVALMDSVTSPLAAGIEYHLISLGNEGDHRVAHVNTAAFSIPFGQALHIGVSTRHVLMTGSRDANAITGDAGLLLNLGGFVMAVSGHNLVDIYNPDFQRYFAASVGWTSPVFSLSTDVRGNFNGPSPLFAVSAGGEWVIGNTVPIRAGYSWDQFRNARILAGGLGVNIEGGALDFAYQYELGGSFSRMMALTLRLQVQ